ARSSCELRRRTNGVKCMASTISRAGGPICAIPTTFAPIGQPLAVAETAAVGTVVAEVEPNWFLARTRTRIACPTSAEVRRNDAFVPPATFPQAPPYWSQRSHWKANVIGVGPVQLPGLAVSVCPSCG